MTLLRAEPVSGRNVRSQARAGFSAAGIFRVYFVHVSTSGHVRSRVTGIRVEAFVVCGAQGCAWARQKTRTAQSRQDAGATVLRDEPGQLLARIAAHLHEDLDDRRTIAPPKGGVLDANQQLLHPTIVGGGDG